MDMTEIGNRELIQNIILAENGIQDGNGALYYRSNARIFVVEDGSYRLEKKNYFDFFTFQNALSIAGWEKYTIAENFYLELEVMGKFDLELFGHYKMDDQYQKEWCGRYTYDLPERTRICVPYPGNVFSTSVAFGIYAKKNTYIYHACYTADLAKEQARQVCICFYTRQGKEPGQMRKNLYTFDHELSGNRKEEEIPVQTANETLPGMEQEQVRRTEEYEFPEFLIDKDGFEWFIHDPYHTMHIDLRERIRVVSGEKPPQTVADMEMPKIPTHILYLDPETQISGESMKQLYTFLRLQREEYQSYTITALTMEIYERNIQRGIYVNSESNTKSPQSNNLDMNIWFNIIESENRLKGLQSEDSSFEWGFLCRPVHDAEYSVDNSFANGKEEHWLTINNFMVWKGRKEEKVFEKKQKGEEILRIQNILMSTMNCPEVTRHMYYRNAEAIRETENGTFILIPDVYYDFFTYFNALSYGKWKKYTNIKDLYLVLEVCGDFDIEIFGHYKNNTGYEKEWFIRTSRSSKSRKTFVFQLPGESKCSVVSFGIMAKGNVEIYDAYYAAKADLKNIRTPDIALVTTTFKKEDYVRRNIELLTEKLFGDENFKEHFHWNIIDNGRTLSEDMSSKSISIISNPNIGGAGGFARGMYESLIQERDYSHILLMDDDVIFMPESFKRLYMLLALVKEDYKDYFISGAMLKMGQPNIQHEDVGMLNEMGYHEAAKPNLDLNLWNSIVDNESFTFDKGHFYAAWWFCCIPVGIARLDNLPLPVFVRGDDVEYSLRNNAKFITMNGLCIWHEGFEGKFSAALEFYQVERNELVVASIHEKLSNVDVLGRIQKLFWEEMYKFNYKGASLLLDALDDYMKGPEYLFDLDGEKVMKEKKALDNQLAPLTEEIKSKINWETLYLYENLPTQKKMVYDYTYNGQARIPEILIKKKSFGVIPYGWGYFQSKMCMVKKIYAIDGLAQKYAVFEKDRKKFKALKKRYDHLMEVILEEGEQIRKGYLTAFEKNVGEECWRERWYE